MFIFSCLTDTSIIYYFYFVVFETSLYIYICVKHFGMTNIKKNYIPLLSFLKQIWRMRQIRKLHVFMFTVYPRLQS